MAYEIVDGYVCDMDGEACLAKYDFGDVEFRVKALELLDKLQNFGKTMSEAAEGWEKSDEFVDFLDRTKLELKVTNEMFKTINELFGEEFSHRHVGGKNVIRLARALGEVVNIGMSSIDNQIADTEKIVAGYVNRAQRRQAAAKK